MTSLNVTCLNVCDFMSKWKYASFLDEIRSDRVDVRVAMESEAGQSAGLLTILGRIREMYFSMFAVNERWGCGV